MSNIQTLYPPEVKALVFHLKDNTSLSLEQIARKVQNEIGYSITKSTVQSYLRKRDKELKAMW